MQNYLKMSLFTVGKLITVVLVVKEINWVVSHNPSTKVLHIYCPPHIYYI